MSVPPRVLACAILLFGAVLFVGYLLVPWLGGPTLIPDDLNEIVRKILDETERREKLDHRDSALLDEIDGKTRVTQGVIDDDVTLAEAVAEFRRLREKLLARLDGELADLMPLGDEAETARQVVRWVLQALEADLRRDAILTRLEAERAGRK